MIDRHDIFKLSSNSENGSVESISYKTIEAEDEASRKHPVFYLLSTEEYIANILSPYSIIRIRVITNFNSNKYFYNKLFGRSINKIVQIFKKDNL